MSLWCRDSTHTIFGCCPCGCECEFCFNRTTEQFLCCPFLDCPCEVCRFTWNNKFGCCPIGGCECGVTFQEETRFWGRVIQPETQYCTPCCRCGLIRLTPFSRETCKFPCPIRIPTGCFPATASVTLENGKQIAMAEVQVGDQVKTSMFMNITLLVILVDLYGFTVIS